MRYELQSAKPVTATELKKAVEQSLHEFLGIYGLAQGNVMLVDNNQTSGIIKVHPKWVDQVKTAIARVKEIHKNKVCLTTTKVSGMINKVK